MIKKIYLLTAVLAYIAVFAQYSVAMAPDGGVTEQQQLCVQQQSVSLSGLDNDLRSTIIMHNGTQTVCNALFYDNGGASGNYTDSDTLTLTMLPQTAGMRIKVTFENFQTEFSDKLCIYNGTSVTSPVLAALRGKIDTLPITFYGDNPEGALTFRFISDIMVNLSGWKATVTCYTPPTDDLSAIRLATQPVAYISQTKLIPVVILNRGANNIAGDQYSVTLSDASNNTIATVQGIDINAAMYDTLLVEYTPTTLEPINLKGTIVYGDDSNQSNNTTPVLKLKVYPQNTHALQLGQDVNTSIIHYPFSFYWKNSCSQSLYTRDMLGISGGILTAIAYDYTFNQNVGSKAVKVWIGETTQPDLSAGIVDPKTLTLVYDGMLDFPAGQHRLTINLQQPYIYKGNNLVVYTYREYTSEIYSSSERFYATDISAMLTRYKVHDSQFDPLNPPSPVKVPWIPNTTFIFSVAGMGTVAGNVLCEGTPVEGVKVEVTDGPIRYTNAAGNYNFSHIFSGQRTLKFSKFGYAEIVDNNVNVVDNQTTTVNVVMSPLQQVMVSGTVRASDTNLPVGGATVKLTGYENYTATTNEFGVYSFSNVWGGGNRYTITVSTNNYQPYSDTLTVNNTNIANHDLVVLEIAYPAKKIMLEEAATDLNVSWVGPYGEAVGGSQWIQWCSSDSVNRVGTNAPATINIAKRFSVANIQALELAGMQITKMKFVPHVGSDSAVYKLRIWTGGSETMPGTLVHEQQATNITKQHWNEIVLTAPVTIPEGSEIWIGVNIVTLGGLPAGCDAGPAVNGYGNLYYYNSQWTPLSTLVPTLNYNWSLAAYVDNAKGQETELKHIFASHSETLIQHATKNLSGEFGEQKPVGLVNKIANQPRAVSQRALISYTLYRLVKNQPQSEWSLLVDQTTDTTFVDNMWSAQPPAVYRYAVVANYTNGVTSKPTMSKSVIKDMELDYTVVITTNTGETPTGAVITLTNRDNLPEHSYQVTVGQSETVIQDVWRGIYDMKIEKEGYVTYQAVDIDINNSGLSHSATLVEKLIAPVALDVVQNGDKQIFSWNNQAGFSDDIEFYNDFIIENIGNYTLVDVDNSSTYVAGTSYTNMGYTGSYIVFNPTTTNPPLPSVWGAHSGVKYLACFAASTPPNNDWIITPMYKIYDGMEFSFWARSVKANYGLEQFNVGISSGSVNPNDFTIISGSTCIEAPQEWTKFTFSLAEYSGQNIRLAIQCVSHDRFALMLDDIFLGIPGAKEKAFSGYTVYLDDVEIATGLTQTNYVFNNLTHGNHKAGVKAVYTTGSSQIVEKTFVHQTELCNVTFKVKQQSDNTPITGAMVYINNDSVLTNNQGIATVAVPKGVYQYRIEKSGYQTFIGNETIDTDKEIEVQMSVGMASDVRVDKLVLFPNPATSTLTVTMGNNADVKVEIFSSSGVVVKSFEMSGGSREISVEELTGGLYYVRITGTKHTTVQSFVKQ